MFNELVQAMASGSARVNYMEDTGPEGTGTVVALYLDKDGGRWAAVAWDHIGVIDYPVECLALAA